MSTDGDKKWCGLPRKRVACGGAFVVVVAVVIVVVLALTGGPDDIDTVEKDEGDLPPVTGGEVTIVRTAAFSGEAAEGTLSLLRVAADDSAVLALNNFVVAEVGCSEFEVRLDEEVVPLTADIVAGTAVDFTEPLPVDFDPDMFDQVSELWDWVFNLLHLLLGAASPEGWVVYCCRHQQSSSTNIYPLHLYHHVVWVNHACRTDFFQGFQSKVLKDKQITSKMEPNPLETGLP